MFIPDKLPHTGISVFAQMGALARKYKVINLAKGAPDFEMPLALKDLSDHYIRQGYNQYAPPNGVPALAQEVSQHISRSYGKELEAESEVLITVGASQAIALAITAFVQAGDEVIILEPAFETYQPMVKLQGGIPILYELEPPHFLIDWEYIQRLISPKTRMLVLNTPHNPTGKTLKESDWNALAEIVRNTDILILSDEAYEHMIYDQQVHQSILRFPQLWLRTLATFSLSKSFDCTGWRIGYMIAPKDLMQVMNKVHQYSVFAPHTAAQHAMAAYMQNPTTLGEIGKTYQKRRDVFQEVLQPTHFELISCEGSFHHLTSIKNISRESDIDFVKKMFMKYGVGAIPLSAFYTSRRDDQLIRFCFARENDSLQQLGERLSKISK